jgi:hypothetical protein
MEKNDEQSDRAPGDTGTEHASGGGGEHGSPGHPGEDEQATGNPAAAGTEDPDDS